MVRRVRGTDRPVRVGYIDEEGREIKPADFALIPTAAYRR
jgi:hypothetical protein